MTSDLPIHQYASNACCLRISFMNSSPIWPTTVVYIEQFTTAIGPIRASPISCTGVAARFSKDLPPTDSHGTRKREQPICTATA